MLVVISLDVFVSQISSVQKLIDSFIFVIVDHSFVRCNLSYPILLQIVIQLVVIYH